MPGHLQAELGLAHSGGAEDDDEGFHDKGMMLQWVMGMATTEARKAGKIKKAMSAAGNHDFPGQET
jgi:hypothetical protein